MFRNNAATIRIESFVGEAEIDCARNELPELQMRAAELIDVMASDTIHKCGFGMPKVGEARNRSCVVRLVLEPAFLFMTGCLHSPEGVRLEDAALRC